MSGHVLVTGGAGFVGTNLADRLAADGRTVLVYDSLARRGSRQNLAWLKRRHGDRVRERVADLSDARALRAAVAGASAVFHLGAQVAVTESLRRPRRDFAVNLGSTIALLEALRRRPAPLLFTSTNKVYGPLRDVPLERDGDRWQPVDPGLRERGISERQPLDFSTPYGCSKGAADQYVVDYARSYGLQTVVFRMSCIYGPHQHGTEDQGWLAHFLTRAIEGQPVTIYGDGRQVRDVLFVADLVEAMLRAEAGVDRLAGSAFNVGGGAENTLSLLGLLARIDELHDRPLETRWAEARPGDQRWYVSDTSRLTEATGWRPQVGAHEGVELLYRWLASVGRRGRRPARARAR